MRGIAVAAVVLYHAGLGAAQGGYVGVDVFFVVSGFLITGLLVRELHETGRVAFGQFYARRIRRLLPMAALVLVVVVIVSSWVVSPLEMRAVTKDGEAAALYVVNYRFAADSTNYLAARANPSPLQHYWSLAVEEQFYLVWPAFIVAASLAWRRSRRMSTTTLAVIVAVVTAASFALSLVWTRRLQPWAFFSLPTRIWELAAGGALALLAPHLLHLPRRVATVLGWSGLAAIVWAVVRFGPSTAFPGAAAVLPVGGTLALLAAGVVRSTSGAGALLSVRPLRAAGRISYSWYLWHWPVLVLVPLAVGHALSLGANLALAAASAFLAALTVELVERPVRYARFLTARTRRSLALGAVLTVSAVVGIGVVARVEPDLGGTGTAQAVQLAPPPGSDVEAQDASGASRTPPPTTSVEDRLSALDTVVDAAVSGAVATGTVPANLDPSIADAHDDRATPFDDGCNAGYDATAPSPCVYGAAASTTTIVLFGDSHATQYFPALEQIANDRGWRLEVFDKTTCPPVEISIFSPVLEHQYTECDQFRAAALSRITAERPALVVLGAARHYGPEYQFQVYGRDWIDGFARTVQAIRSTGAAVMVMGPTPKSSTQDVPACLSANLDQVSACLTPTDVAVDHAGLTAEELAVERAGGAYVDVTPWVCTSEECAVIIGNDLVYRDDNHLTTTFVSWLTPLLATEIDVARQASAQPAQAGGVAAPRP
jgi:peptidoglycan/LPS O-acetylase OafA/YrhL